MKFRKALSLTRNPNPCAPLAAVLRFDVSEPVSGQIEVVNAQYRHSIDIEPGEGAREIAVAGMRPGVEHEVRVHLQDESGGTQWEEGFTYTPPTLTDNPIETPPIDVVRSRPDDMEPGFLFLSVRRRAVTRAIWWTPRQKKFCQGWSMIVALDPYGEVVWTFHHDKRIAGLTLLPNGNIFFHQVNFQSIEIDLLGNVVRSWVAARRPDGPAEGAIPIDVQSLHHQPHILPNGNFLAMSANTREVDNYISDEYDPEAPRQTIGVVGDKILEFSPEGEIVWSWDSFEHLDVKRVGYHVLEPYWDTRGFPGHADWTHGNGVGYDPEDDSILMSLRHQDAILKVDRAGEIKWIHGTHDGWTGEMCDKLLTPVGDFSWHWHGHNPRVTPHGTFIMYDNAILQSRPYKVPRPPAECFARGVEYQVDEDRMEVREVWSSRSEDPSDNVFSWAMGDAHRLPETDNRLVIDSCCLSDDDPLDARGKVSWKDITWDEWDRTTWHASDFSYWARIREYRSDSHDVVFEVRVQDQLGIMGWEVFGGSKTPAMGRGSAGH